MILTIGDSEIQKHEIRDSALKYFIQTILVEKTLDSLQNTDFINSCGVMKNEFLIKLTSNKKCKFYVYKEITAGDTSCSNSLIYRIQKAVKSRL